MGVGWFCGWGGNEARAVAEGGQSADAAYDSGGGGCHRPKFSPENFGRPEPPGNFPSGNLQGKSEDNLGRTGTPDNFPNPSHDNFPGVTTFWGGFA